MRYEWIDEYLLSKKGVTKDYKAEWEAERFLLHGKMLAMKGGDKHAKPIITLKCPPELGKTLRAQYEHIVPGYYMNKEHWNSVYMEGDVPDDVVRRMCDFSYDLIRNSLPKKIQAELEG